MINKVWNSLTGIIQKIIATTNLNKPDEIFKALVETGYKMIPFPVNLLINEESFVTSCEQSKDAILKLIFEILKKNS